jgi:hypothetical protein
LPCSILCSLFPCFDIFDSNADRLESASFLFRERKIREVSEERRNKRRRKRSRRRS